MNLTVEKRERVTTGGNGRGETRSEIGKVIGINADAPTTDTWEKMYRAFGRWGKVQVLLVLCGQKCGCLKSIYIFPILKSYFSNNPLALAPMMAKACLIADLTSTYLQTR